MIKVRILQLVSNFYIDSMELEKENSIALGEYCTFGYFDALHVETAWTIEDKRGAIWEKVTETTVNNLNGKSNRRNLVCITDEVEKDEKFWSRNDRPMLFMSLIRVSQEGVCGDDIQSNIDQINQQDDYAIAYYSNAHSEVIVLRKDNSFRGGMEYVIGLRDKFKTFKIHSVFSIMEDVISSPERIKELIEDELVNCRFRASLNINEIKKNGNDNSVRSLIGKSIGQYIKLLESKMGIQLLQKSNTNEEKGNGEATVCVWNTLGNTDILIEMDYVPLHKLLTCYKMGSLLTHSNKEYKSRFFNIETELLPCKELLWNE